MNSDYIPALSPYFHVFAIAKNMKSVRQFWIGHRGRRSDIGPDRKRRSDFANAKLQPFKVGADCCTHCLLDRVWMTQLPISSQRKSLRSPLRDFKDARRLGLALERDWSQVFNTSHCPVETLAHCFRDQEPGLKLFGCLLQSIAIRSPRIFGLSRRGYDKVSVRTLPSITAWT